MELIDNVAIIKWCSVLHRYKEVKLNLIMLHAYHYVSNYSKPV